ncbi:MAG: Mrp/NBP35 family ATP-binding protein, partial [Desulfobacterium sp.]|nr:Mrp/NBP35 family ATP-binding protein [Desulfobacterium sp.]MBU4036577.1 Mrp/NBP35 family ATP-binding protein [Pseudomonadota bacterium]
FACPHCNKDIDLFGAGGGEKMAGESGIIFLGKVPFDHNVVSCGDSGTSLINNYSGSPVAKAFDAIADKMAKLVSI